MIDRYSYFCSLSRDKKRQRSPLYLRPQQVLFANVSRWSQTIIMQLLLLQYCLNRTNIIFCVFVVSFTIVHLTLRVSFSKFATLSFLFGLFDVSIKIRSGNQPTQANSIQFQFRVTNEPSADWRKQNINWPTDNILWCISRWNVRCIAISFILGAVSATEAHMLCLKIARNREHFPIRAIGNNQHSVRQYVLCSGKRSHLQMTIDEMKKSSKLCYAHKINRNQN